MQLPILQTPDSLNYIGLFLSLECNLNCSYCINDPEQQSRRSSLFPMGTKSLRKSLTPQEWAKAILRLPHRADLPITLQGGEPTLYHGTKGLGELLSQVPHQFDLLTNFALSPEIFVRNLQGQQAKLRRDAPYPSIRVSYHPEEMNRVWKEKGFQELVERCVALGELGFTVSGNKANSDVGIYMVAHPNNLITPELKSIAKNRVPFETKEFLGVEKGELYGHYLYPFSTDLLARKIHPTPLSCECKTSELLIDPLGFVWGCHFYLYEAWVHGGPLQEFANLENCNFQFSKFEQDLFNERAICPLGHLLDPAFSLAVLNQYHPCNQYGKCIGCDTKIKNDRFQNYYDKGLQHTSVQIRNINMPPELLGKIENLSMAKKFISPETFKSQLV